MVISDDLLMAVGDSILEAVEEIIVLVLDVQVFSRIDVWGLKICKRSFALWF